MLEKLITSEYLGPIFMSFLTWAISRSKSKIDAFFDNIEARKREVQELREELGKQKQINEAIWRNIEKIKEKIEK